MEALKPLIKANALPLLQNIRGLALTPEADIRLLEDAEVTSEGLVETNDRGEAAYRGSTMVTIDLTRLAGRGGVEERILIVLGEAARRSLLLRTRLLRMARAEAERRAAPWLLSGMAAETEFRVEGGTLLIDIDVECPLAALARRGRRREERGR